MIITSTGNPQDTGKAVTPHPISVPHTWQSVRRQTVAFVERWLGPVVKRIFYVLAFDVLVRDMTQPVPAGRTIHPAITLRRIARDEKPWWESMLKPRRATQVRAAVADGDIACTAVVDDKVVGEVWATRTTKGDVRISLAAGDAYTYGLQTDKHYRSLGTAYAVMAGLLGDVQREWQVSTLYAYIDKRNRLSQVFLRTCFSFRQVQRARRVRIFRRWGFVVPGSAVPAHGPLSASRRHRLTAG